jgi:hypothetical protein
MFHWVGIKGYFLIISHRINPGTMKMKKKAQARASPAVRVERGCIRGGI